MFLRFSASERYSFAAPELILEKSAYFQEASSFTSPASTLAEFEAAVVSGTSVVRNAVAT